MDPVYVLVLQKMVPSLPLLEAYILPNQTHHPLPQIRMLESKAPLSLTEIQIRLYLPSRQSKSLWLGSVNDVDQPSLVQLLSLSLSQSPVSGEPESSFLARFASLRAGKSDLREERT